MENNGKQEIREELFWTNIDEKTIENEIAGLVSRINEVSTHLHNMVEDLDYDKTDELFRSLWLNDFGSGGWIAAFINNNDVFREHAYKNLRPTWYHDLTPENQKNYHTGLRYYEDFLYIQKCMNEIRIIMMLLPLKPAYKCMRVVDTFDVVGFDESLYDRINTEIQEVARIVTQNWTAMERNATRCKRFYDENYGKMSKEELVQGYRKERIRDYQDQVNASKAYRSFIANSVGTFSVDPNMLIDMKVLDKYTTEIAFMENFGDDMKKAMQDCSKINSESLETAFKKCLSTGAESLIRALDKLVTEIYQFADLSNSTYNKFKEHGIDAPYCFLHKLPAYSSIKNIYTAPASKDPWQWGTDFYNLYKHGARSLSLH